MTFTELAATIRKMTPEQRAKAASFLDGDGDLVEIRRVVSYAQYLIDTDAESDIVDEVDPEQMILLDNDWVAIQDINRGEWRTVDLDIIQTVAQTFQEADDPMTAADFERLVEYTCDHQGWKLRRVLDLLGRAMGYLERDGGVTVEDRIIPPDAVPNVVYGILAALGKTLVLRRINELSDGDQ